jgi:hypothetical protein
MIGAATMAKATAGSFSLANDGSSIGSDPTTPKAACPSRIGR